MNIANFFAVIQISDKIVLNEKAQQIFKNDEKKISNFIKEIEFDKKIVFCYIDNKLYAVNIIKDKDIILLLTEIEDKSMFCSNYKKENEIVLFSKYMIEEFLEKLLSLKRRYGGFNIKFLYIKVNFTLDVEKSIKLDILDKISKYILSITRSSDVVGLIDEYTFGVILTNSSPDGASMIMNRLTKYINELNVGYGKRFIELEAVLVYEHFILNNTKFDKMFEKLNQEVEFITSGSQLKELIK